MRSLGIGGTGIVRAGKSSLLVDPKKAGQFFVSSVSLWLLPYVSYCGNVYLSSTWYSSARFSPTFSVTCVSASRQATSPGLRGLSILRPSASI
jgi:hypothetical protein